MDAVKKTAAIALMAAVVGFTVWGELYHFRDCLRVGHTRLYCLYDIVR